VKELYKMPSSTPRNSSHNSDAENNGNPAEGHTISTNLSVTESTGSGEGRDMMNLHRTCTHRHHHHHHHDQQNVRRDGTTPWHLSATGQGDAPGLSSHVRTVLSTLGACKPLPLASGSSTRHHHHPGSHYQQLIAK